MIQYNKLHIYENEAEQYIFALYIHIMSKDTYNEYMWANNQYGLEIQIRFVP